MSLKTITAYIETEAEAVGAEVETLFKKFVADLKDLGHIVKHNSIESTTHQVKAEGTGDGRREHQELHTTTFSAPNSPPAPGTTSVTVAPVPTVAVPATETTAASVGPTETVFPPTPAVVVGSAPTGATAA